MALTGLALASAGMDGSSDDAVATATTLTLLVGVALLVFRLVRLGWVVEAVSGATVTGLKVAVGLTIMADQLPKLLGIAPEDGGFFADVGNAVSNIGSTNTATIILAVVTLVGLVAMKRWTPRIPGPLVALAVGIGLVALFGIHDRGVELIPAVPTGLSRAGSTALGARRRLGAVRLGHRFHVELRDRDGRPPVAAARGSAARKQPRVRRGGSGEHRRCLLPYGAPAGGFSQTQVYADAGARTQLSELVTAAALAVAVALFLAPVLDDLPEATLGAIVVVAVSGLVGLDEFVRLGRVDRVELWVAVVTGAFALAVNLLVGVVAGVVMTLYLVLRELNHPVIVELRRPPGATELEPAREGDEPVPGMLVHRVEGRLYTMNVRGVQTYILDRVAAEHPPPQVVLLDVGGTADTSVTVMDVFAERTTAWSEWSQAGRVHSTVAAAVAAFGQRSDG